MERALIGTLLITFLAIGCSKDKEVEKPAAVQAPVKRSVKHRVRTPAPEPDSACTLAQGEHARPPSLTFQNGVTVEGKAFAGTTDATIENGATGNAGAETSLIAKGGKKPRHGLVRWDLSGVPATTTIQGACLAVFIEDPSNQSYSVSELLRDWSESQVTWDSATAKIPWETPGAWGATDSGAEATTIPSKATGLQTVALPTSLVQKWIAKQAENHGLVIANNRSFDALTISSANSPTASQRPALLIWK